MWHAFDSDQNLKDKFFRLLVTVFSKPSAALKLKRNTARYAATSMEKYKYIHEVNRKPLQAALRRLDNKCSGHVRCALLIYILFLFPIQQYNH